MSNKQKIICIAIGAAIAYGITSYFRKKREEQFAEDINVLKDAAIELAQKKLQEDYVKLEEELSQIYKED